MSRIPSSFQQRMVNLLAYGYKTLTLFFLFFSLLRFLADDGGWINEFVVFLILSCAFVLVLIFRHWGRNDVQSD